MKFEITKNGEVVLSKELTEGSYKIGRAGDCDIVLESSKVSKHHALLVIRGERAAIVDTDSSNGVFVNGILVKKQLLKSSDTIGIGEFQIRKPQLKKLKKELEVFSTSGGLALDKKAEEQLFKQSQEIEVPDLPSVPAAEISAGEKLISFVDTKLLIPFYEIVRVTDYRYLAAVILVLSIGAASIFSVTPVLAWGNEIVKKEALKRGHTIIKQLVRENYRILSKSKDFSMLTTAAAESEKDMLEVYLVDTKTKSVLAPSKYLSKSLNDPYVLIALEDLAESNSGEITKNRGDGTFVLAQSIPYYSTVESISEEEGEDTESNVPLVVVVGYFKIPKTVVGVYEPLAVSGLISLLLALLAFFFIYKMISHPISRLNEQLDAVLKGDDVQLSCVAKFKELETLTTVINFAVSRMKSASGGLASSPSGIPGGFDFESEEKSYLKTVDEFCLGSTDAILVIDRDKKIKVVSPVLADLLSLRPQYAIGQNIGDACRDGSFSGTAIELAEKVISSLGENQTATLEINGISRNLSAIGHRLSNGDIEFIVITVKMNG